MKELTPQQQHQREVWEEARTCKPTQPRTEEEIKQQEIRNALRLTEINALTELLNDGRDEPRTSLTILVNGELVEFNIAAIETAIHAHNFGWRPAHARHHGLPTVLSVEHYLFPEVTFEKKGEKIIKKVYTFDCTNRTATLVLTRCTPEKNGDTWGQPRYDETHQSTGVLDNLTWRCVVNGMIEPFGAAGYVHLYGRDFKYIWDYETCKTDILPRKDDGSFEE